MRDDPIPDETVRLVVEQSNAERDTFASTVDELSGSIERELRFESYLIEIPQSAVEDLCELSGLARIETANTLSITAVEDSVDSEVDGEEVDSEADRKMVESERANVDESDRD